MIRIKPGQPRFTYWPRRYETPSDIFRKGDLGGLWGPNHFTDVEGTIPASLGDKIASIEDPRTQTINWVQVNPDYRPTLLDGNLSFVEGRGNIESVETYPAGFYTVVFAGTLGIWIDTMEWEGGKFKVGISSYSGGPAGVLVQLGGLQVEGCILISRELTKSEKEYLINYFGGEVQDFWSPEELFANGEQGALWGPLPYYSDAAGTVEAAWGYPVGNIPDASGNGAAWSQVTSTARPILGRVPVGGRRNWVDTSDVQKWPGGGGAEVLVTPGVDDPYGGTEAYRCVGNSNLYRLSMVLPGGLAAFPDQQMTLTFWMRWVSGSPSIRLNGRVNVFTFPIDTSGEWAKYSVNTPDLVSGIQQIRLKQDQVVDIAFVQLEPGTEETPYQRVGNEYDITEAGARGIYYLRFDGTDDQVTTTLPSISGGTIVLAGKNGIWIDEIDFAGGAFSVGPNTYTGGPTGLMSILGNLLVGGGFVINRVLTPEEIAQVKGYYVARGSAGLIELGPELVVNGDFSNGTTGWTPINCSIAVASGALLVTSSGTFPGAGAPAAGSVAGLYLASFDLLSGSTLLAFKGSANGTGTTLASTTAIPVDAVGRHRYAATFPQFASVKLDGVTNANFSADNVSVRRLIMPGDTP